MSYLIWQTEILSVKFEHVTEGKDRILQYIFSYIWSELCSAILSRDDTVGSQIVRKDDWIIGNNQRLSDFTKAVFDFEYLITMWFFIRKFTTYRYFEKWRASRSGANAISTRRLNGYLPAIKNHVVRFYRNVLFCYSRSDFAPLLRSACSQAIYYTITSHDKCARRIDISIDL